MNKITREEFENTTRYCGVCGVQYQGDKHVHKYLMPMDGLALQSPTPEQIDHDIIGELSRLRQKVAELEGNKKFYEDIAKDIGKRLNEAEKKLDSIAEQFLHFIELRKIKGTG